MINSLASRPFEKKGGIAYFVPETETEPIQSGWIEKNWRGHVSSPIVSHISAAERMISAGRLFLEVGAGPDGGFTYYVLNKDRDARLIISDIEPAVVKEWSRFFQKGIRPQNLMYAVLDACDIPFRDCSVDVVSWHGRFASFKGDNGKAISEIYRVLKPGGLYVSSSISVDAGYAKTLPEKALGIIKGKYPALFSDYLRESYEIGFAEIENIRGANWSNEGDSSDLAELCRELGVHLLFTPYLRFCYKGPA